jgi:septal ring factor EnvC (AmiA/AmiB activator)
MDMEECIAAAQTLQAQLARMGVQITQMQVDLAATVACLQECADDMAEMEAEMADMPNMQMSMEDKQRVLDVLKAK